MGEKAWWNNPWTCGIGGCCAGCVAIPVLIVSIFGVGLFGFLRSSDVLQDAAEVAKNHPEVIARLGEPVKMGWQISGSINVDGNRGTADFEVPLSGPLGSGTLSVEATKKGGEWTYDRLELTTDENPETIDLIASRLLPEAEPGASPTY
jgi:hypothetical protein